MDMDKIGLLAQEISFAFEDHYSDAEKRQAFDGIFHKYLSTVDPESAMIPYDAMIKLGRSNPAEFEMMVREIKEKSLIP